MTKLLNIDKDDSIEDVVELLKSAEAANFMLLVPRGHKAFKNEDDLRFLKEKAEEIGKTINVITSDKEILANLAALDISFEEPMAQLAHSKPKITKKSSSRVPLIIREILPSSPSREIEIEAKREKEKDLEIKRFMTEKIPEKGEEFRPQISYPRPIKLSSKKIFIPILIVLLLLFFVGVSAALSKTKVTIKPQKLPLDLNLNITVKEGLLGVSSQDNTIPGKITVIEKEVGDTFNSTGEKELLEKAKGKITVYNKFSSSPQIFVATTRFESPPGLIFRTPKTITIPGAKIEGGQLTAGSIEIEVIAAKPGAEYNIEPADFTVPGLKGSPKYEGFYAKSFTKMNGGALGKTKYVSEGDFNKALKILEEKLKQELKAKETEAEKKFLNEGVSQEIFLTPDSNKINDLGETFRLTLKAKISAMNFEEKDIKNLVQYYYNDKIEDQLPIVNTLQVVYTKAEFAPASKKMSLKTKINGQAAYKIDVKKIAREIAGKKINQVQEYFKNQENIESAKIVITPFWASKTTDNLNKIEVKIEY